MKNFKILRKVMLLALVLTMIVGAFAVNGSAAEATTVSGAKNLLKGVTFDDYDGTTAAADYIYSSAGMLITDTNLTTHHSNVTLDGNPSDGYALHINELEQENVLEQAVFVDAKGSDGTYNADEYAKNKDILDLLYSTTGPSKFSLSMDMTIHDNDDDNTNAGNIPQTYDNGNSLSSYYRGISVLSFVGYRWTIKATSANIPTYIVDSDGYMVLDSNGVAENMKGKGYLYPNGQTDSIKVKDADAYSSLGSGTDEQKITCGAAIKSSYMTSPDVVTYTMGVPFNIELRFTRGATTMSVQPYINGRAFGSAVSYSLDTGTSTAGKTFGLRIFDQSPICDIDNIKVTITGCAEKHDGTANTHTGLWSTVNTVITNTPDSFNVKKVCMDSGIAFENYFVTSTIANEIKDVVVDKYTTDTLTINDANGIVNGSSDYWIAADINTRDGFAAPKSDTTLITVGGSPVLKLDTEGKLVMADGVAVSDALVAKNSYALALNIIPTETAGYYDCAVYIDGQLVGTAKNVSVGDSTVQLDAYNALRLLNIKAVKLGTAGDAVTVKSVAETEAMPCVGHAARPDTYAWYQNVTNAAKGINDLTFSYICDRCGERLYEKQGANLYASKNTYFEDDAIWSVDTDHNTSDIYLDTSVTLTDGYWVVFDLEVVSLDTSAVAAKGGNGNLLNAWGTFDSFLRLYTIGDTDGDLTTLDYELSQLGTQGTDCNISSDGVYNTEYLLLGHKYGSNIRNKLAIITEGETYRIAIHSPHASTDTTKIYVNGELMAENARSLSSFPEKVLRLKDGKYGAFNLSNFSFVNSVDTEYAPHVHSDEWSDGYTITNGYNTLDLTYTCYCGETASAGSVSEYVKLDSVYYGKAEIKDLPTTGDYWFTTNYYIATAEALAEAANVISVGDYSVLTAGELAPEVGKTYEIMVNVAYSAENAAVKVYVDNTLVKNVENVDLSALGSIVTLGDAAGTDVRFRYPKAVILGKTDAPKLVEFNKIEDETFKPCYHEGVVGFVVVKGAEYGSDKHIQNVYGLAKKYDCTKCGEIIYVPQGETLTVDQDYNQTSTERYMSLDATGSYIGNTEDGEGDTFNNPSYIVTDMDSIGNKADPFWISFDLKFNANSEQMSTVSGKNNGGTSFFALRAKRSSIFIQLLRGYAIDKPGGGFYQDRYGITLSSARAPATGVAGWANAVLMAGQTYNVAIYIEPGVSEYYHTVYIDGKNVGTQRSASNIDKFGVADDTYMLRFLDGNYGDFNISNFAFAKAVADHVHNDKWTAPTEKRVVMTDTSLDYFYTCYCRATVTAGIDEVLKDAIIPKYSVTEETVMLPVSEYDMSTAEKDFWLLTNVKVNTYPASSKPHALISVGDTDLVSIDNVGNIKVGGADTEAVLTNRTYMPFAINFDVSTSTYYVYYERVCIGKGTVDTLAADIKVAGGNSGNYHFDRMALVALAVDSDLSFTSGDDGHVHANLPENTSLVFNADKTTVQLTYTCSVCDKFIKEGIKTNLYDDPTDDTISTVAPVYGGEISSITTVSELINSETPCWISMYVTLEDASSYKGNYPFAALVSAEGESVDILNLGVEGLVKDVAGHSLGRIGKTEANITMSVIEVDGKYSICYYIDGKYCATRRVEIDGTQAYELVLGNDEVATLSLTDIKLAELAVGTNYAIGAYVCRDGHTIAVNSKTVIEYFDVNSFKVFYNCAVCGTSASDEVVASYYDSTPHIYEAEGEVGKNAVEGINASAYWISVDVNVRTGTFGKFNGYVPLISYNGTAYLLINSNGDLMLGDGTKLSVRMPMYKITTYNVALRYDTESGKLCAFVDGKYVGCSTGTVDQIGIQAANKREHFGAPELENIRYYNIKSVVTGAAPANKISLEFVEDVSYVPCAHNQFYQSVGVILKTGEPIREIYICNTCGERYTIYRDNDIFDPSLASKGEGKGISTTEFTVSSDKQLHSTGDIMSAESTLGNEPYWVRFTVEAEEIIDGDALVAQKGRAVTTGGVTFFGTANSVPNHGHLLRLFPVAKPTGGYYDDRAVLRTGNSSNAQLVTTIYEGETYDFAIRVTPANGVFQVYLNGEYVTTQKGRVLSAGTDKYYFRFLDGAWGTYNVSNLEFVAGAAHEHTPKYVPYMDGGYDVLAYGDATLTHRYSCYCGEEIVEGIDEIHLDAIIDMSVSEKTAISSTDIAMGYKPYWISAKVHYGSSSALVYSIGGTSLVETVGTDSVVYKVGGVETAVVASLKDYDVVSVRVEPKSGEYYVYVNGAFIGSGKYDFGINSNFNILLGGDTALKFTNIKLVSLAEGAEIAAPVVPDADISLPKIHMPTSDNHGNITYGEDGSLKHEFVCSICSADSESVTHTYDCANELQNASLNNGKIVTELLGVTSQRTVKVSEGVVSTAGTPYWFFVDITPDSVNAGAIQGKGSSGASILAIRRLYDSNGDGTVSSNEVKYINLLRAYYRNEKVVLDSPYDSGSTLERELVAGETLRYAFAIDPTNGEILFYVNGKYCGKGTVTLPTGGEKYEIRFTDGNYGNFDFTNIKLVKLTDQCVHDQSCVDGATYECADCGMKVPAAHNYVATLDATKMWTKYTCEDCGKYHIEFNDKSLLVDEDGNELTFATNALLLEYLTKTYMPVFPVKEIGAE